MRDRHQTEVSHHQARIDREAEAHETEQESREAYAKTVDWKEVGERAIRSMSDNDKVEQMENSIAHHHLARVFDFIVLELTDWIPMPNSIDRAADVDWDVQHALHKIRDHQAELARQHFLETGELE
jgi:hypothetical protein